MKHESTIKNETLKKVLTLICNQFDFSFTVDQKLALELSYNKGAGGAKFMLDVSMEGVREFMDTLESHSNKIYGIVAPDFYEKCSIGEELSRLEFDLLTLKDKAAHLFGKKRGAWGKATKADEKRAVEISILEGFINSLKHQRDSVTADELREIRGQRDDSRLVQMLIRSELHGNKAQDSANGAKLEVKGSGKGKGQAAKEAKKEAVNDFAEKAIEKALNAKEYTALDKAVYFNGDFDIEEKKEGVKQGLGRLVKANDFPGILLVWHGRIDGSNVSLLHKNHLFYFEDLTEGGDQIQKAIDLIKMKRLDNLLKMAEESLLAA